MAFNEETGRYEIHKVMGPDEFHEKMPGSKTGGLKDNAYTNIMVVWMFNRAFELLDNLEKDQRRQVFDKISLDESELQRWKEMASLVNLVISDDGIIAQFDGYFDLEELDWEHYRKKYDTIYRMDRLLKAEGKSPDNYKLSKQADTLMTFYNIGQQAVTEILENLGYKVPDGYMENNFDYYIQRCSHGSTLSRVVHASLAVQAGRKDPGWKLFREALRSDYTDIQGGTTAEGIHAGVMGGTVLMAMEAFGGLSVKDKELHVDPHLPDHWRSISFGTSYRGNEYVLKIEHGRVSISTAANGRPTPVMVRGRKYELVPGEKLVCNIED
jgi:trehalose/maltose hydrolase-like predicted phosphorylase